MRCVVQRVKEASVTVAGETVGKIGPGYMVLIGVSVEDTEKDVRGSAHLLALFAFWNLFGILSSPPSSAMSFTSLSLMEIKTKRL